MSYYLDLGVGSIQSYLARSPDLRGRRGASAMLSEATDATRTWSDILRDPIFAGVRWNAEAGNIAGVVSLKLANAEDADRVAAAVLLQLRQRLPAAVLKLLHGPGDSYADFTRSSPETHVFYPAVMENPLAKRCGDCGLSAACSRDGRCEDCTQRRVHGGTQDNEPWALQIIRDRLEEVFPGAKSPQDLKGLSKLGLVKSGDTATRLAVVYADGNAVGEFVSTALKSGADKRQISKVIDEATVAAMVRAAASSCRLEGRGDLIALTPHIVGGDDVLVSMPASAAWDFVATFLTAFDEEVKSSARKYKVLKDRNQQGVQDKDLPTMSVGMVFHHYSQPLNSCIDLAARLLTDHAKRSGDRARIAWIDLMNDDPQRVDDYPSAQSAEWISEKVNGTSRLDLIRSFAQTPSSHLKLLRSHAQDTSKGLSGRVNIVQYAAEKHGTWEDLKKIIGAPTKGQETHWIDQIRWVLGIATDLPASQEVSVEA